MVPVDGSGGLCEYHVALWSIRGQFVCSLELVRATDRLWYGTSSQKGGPSRGCALCRNSDPGECSVVLVHKIEESVVITKSNESHESKER